MINLKFKVNKDVLAREMIYKSRCIPKDFANYLWEKYNDSYRKLKFDPRNDKIDKNIFAELKMQPFFKELVKNSYTNCKKMQNLWKLNKQKITKFLTTILRKDIDLDLTANIVAPEICAGMNLRNNQFVWGHKKGETDLNYNLVYMTHESLHSYFDMDDISHAIIENITDIELSKYLNKTEVGYSMHEFTQDAHIQIFPYWNLYLNRTKDEIKKEQTTLNLFYNIDEYEYLRNDFKNINIDEFVVSCKNILESELIQKS